MKSNEIFKYKFKPDFLKVMNDANDVSGLTLKEVGKKAGLTYEGVRQILKGNGSVNSTIAVCKALKINMKDILKRGG